MLEREFRAGSFNFVFTMSFTFICSFLLSVSTTALTPGLIILLFDS